MFPKRSDAVLQVRRRALMENNLLVKDPEIVTIMNRHVGSIYKHCLTALGADTFAERFVIAGIGAEASKPAVMWPNTQKTIAGVPAVEATAFSLPLDFYRLLRCDWCKGTVSASVQTGGTFWLTGANKVDWCPMQRVEIRSGVIDDTPREWAAGLVGYWLKGTPGSTTYSENGNVDITTTWWIAFLPPPSAIVSVSIWYTPRAPQFSMTDDSNQIRLQDEAWEFVMNMTAAEMLDKQGRDPSARMAAAMNAKGELLTSQVGPDDENAWGTIDVGGSQVPHGRRRNVWGP